VSRAQTAATSTAASTGPLTACIPDWPRRAAGTMPVLGVLAGEGIGSEVIGAALIVLDAVRAANRLTMEVRQGVMSGGTSPAADRLSRDTADFCESIFAAGGALFCGPVGGRFVYDLRAHFDLYCKLVPLRPSPALCDASILRPQRLGGVDVLIVRENVGGLYFGEYGRRDGGRVAYQNLSYCADHVARVVEVAARLARARRGGLAIVVKAGGVPAVSDLWCEVAESVAANHVVELEILQIDNASFQLIADPARFDVIAAPNCFGDVLADAATALLSSRGMSYSANFGPEGRASYQTGHGAALDLAGSGRANPVAQILSLAMMLRESFTLAREASCLEAAVENVLAAGVRTADIAGPESRVVGTVELAECVAREVWHLVRRDRESR
jgi:3-isopropylmalate dehydrogenase